MVSSISNIVNCIIFGYGVTYSQYKSFSYKSIPSIEIND